MIHTTIAQAVVALLIVGQSFFSVDLLQTDEAGTERRFDLSHWKLTLPVDSKGTTKGTAAEVSSAMLSSGYSHNEYFYHGTDGELVFWCPVTGAKTKSTEYPRSELRELINPDDDNVCWKGQGTHVLRARCRVLQVPSSKKVVIGQIHSHSGEARPLIKLQFFRGRVIALVKEKASSGKDLKLTFAEIEPGRDIDYEIALSNGRLNVIVNGETQSIGVFEKDPNWAQQTFYFKLGAYTQDNEGPASEGARVSFSSFSVTHD